MPSILKQILSTPNGAQFYRADLHIHSYGGSCDVKDKDMIPENIIKTAIDEKLSLISITDHNEITNVAKAIEISKHTSLLVIPGIELSTSQGHLLCYLDSFEKLQQFHGRLQFEDRGKDTSHCKNSILECLTKLSELDGFAILAHVDGDGGFEKMMPGGSTPHKIDIFCDKSLLGIELLSLASNISYSNIDPMADRAKLGIERIKRLSLGQLQHIARVLNSDSHKLKNIGKNYKGQQKVTRIKMDKPSFVALRIALGDADARIRIEDEIPTTNPMVVGIYEEGGFLDGLKIHFNPNLNCIIGGRGTGKSATFEGIRCLIKEVIPEKIVDSEVWPNHLNIFWKDQAEQIFTLHRPINGEIVNMDDPIGPTSFDIESYGQGETTNISHSAKEDPLALLPYLDRFIKISDLETEENEIRDELLNCWSEIEKANKNVESIPNYEKDLETKTKQLAVLEKAKAKEIIKLQRGLEEEKRARLQISENLSEIEDNLDKLDVSSSIEEMIAIADYKTLTVGSLELKKIITDAKIFIQNNGELNKKNIEAFDKFKKDVNVNLTSWKEKEATINKKIEDKKDELIAQGIRPDMAFIKKLTEDEAKLKTTLEVLKKWITHLSSLRKKYATLSKKRWTIREKIAMTRVGYAKVASETLKSTLKDLTVSLKFAPNSYSPEAEKQIISAMNWKTTQVPRAALILEKITLPNLLEIIDKKDHKPLLSVKTSDGINIFTTSDAKAIIESLSEPSVRFALERSEVHDIPRLNISGLIKRKDGNTQHVVKDFTKLSLGQQQSILLALMLSSKSNIPLIIDQPEDHLDSEFIYKTLIPVIRQAKERRQIIIVTHNPNIAVLGDAEQIIVLKSTNEKGSIVCKGSIDDPATCEMTCNILEGTREAFNRRAKIYGTI